jgi:hypothetical protein
MTEAIASVVKKLRRVLNYGELPSTVYDDAPAKVQERYRNDCLFLAAHYLAEHPSDEAEPVTVEWLVSIGGQLLEHDSKCVWYRVRFGDYLLYKHEHTVPAYCKFYGRVIELSSDTRGVFRRLCQALGVTLKE